MTNLVSIIIVNYNAKELLAGCISSIVKNSYNNYEIIVVDNASTDGSDEYIKTKFESILSKLTILKLDKNYGPAKARNEGVKIAKGNIIGFLDNDTEVNSNWITEALTTFSKDKKIGILQCKLLLLDEPNKLDYTGEYIGHNGFLIHRSKYKEVDKGQYDDEIEILAAKSAGMFIRKEVFNTIAGFDEDYFIYVEETDLGWRSWLAGYKVIFCPNSIVYHKNFTTSSIVNKRTSNQLVRFHGTKNYIITLIKNLGSKQLILILPIHIIIWVGLCFFLFIRGNFYSSLNIIRGIFWNIIHLRITLIKRKKIQSSRLITDKILLKQIMRKESLIMKIKQFLYAKKIVTTTEHH